MRRIATHLAALIALAAVDPMDCRADDDDSADTGAAVAFTVMPSGMGRHVAGRWASMAIDSVNRTDSDVEETAIVSIGDQPHLQFARRFWIPAGSKRRSWLPIRIPADIRPSQLQVEMNSIHLKASDDGEEEFQQNMLGMPHTTRRLLLSSEGSRTGAYLETTDEELNTYSRRARLLAFVYAGRDRTRTSGQDLGIILFGNSFLPPSLKALDSIDQIVIAGDAVLRDSMAVARLREWLHAGGRMWIMVDKVSPQVVRRLLGDAMCYSEVDHVELNDFEMEVVSTLTLALPSEFTQWSSDTPAEFVRVLAEADDVQCRIDGWPAAFWKQVGYGEVLFTTLGANGWLDGQTPQHPYMASARRFFVSKLEPPKYTDAMTPIVQDEIGYTIPSRGLVGGILGLHAFVFLLAGIWITRSGQAQYLSILVPSAALVAGGSLVAVGMQKTRSVPSTVATGQIVRVSAEGSEARVDSIAAVYSQEVVPLQVESPSNTMTMLSDLEPGEMKRMVWTDDGQSRWVHVSQPPGAVRLVESSSKKTLPRPWIVKGTFGERGFEGHLEGLGAGRREDSVIVAAAAPALAVQFDDDASDTFHSSIDDVLPQDQFIDDSLMSEVQRQRQEAMRRLSRGDTPMFGREPSFVLWTDPVDVQLRFNEQFVRRGSTLASIPIRFIRPASGSTFRVPASFVRIETLSTTRIRSSVVNPQTGRWIEDLNKPNRTELQCVVPEVLLPCEVTRADVSIRINAPSRTLQVIGRAGGNDVILFQETDPRGLLRFEIDRLDALQLNEEGRVLLSIAVSETAEELAEAQKPDVEKSRVPSRDTWTIEYVHVNLEGTTL